MTGLFVLDAGIYLWLAVMLILLVGLFLEPGEGKSVKTIIVQRIFITIASVACLGIILTESWGTIALATLIVLACGMMAILISFALNRARGPDQKRLPTSAIGALTAFGVMVFMCFLIFPTILNLEFEQYSYGTEIRQLMPVRGDRPEYLAEHHSEDSYIFRFVREKGDTLDNKRYILYTDQVVFLDEDSADISHVEGEASVRTKIDPVSGQPLEIICSKVFQPTKLYIRSSEVWTGNI